MVQAHAYELLNQKESSDSRQGSNMSQSDHPLYAATDRLIAALDRLEDNLHYAADQQKSAARTLEQEEQMRLFEQENQVLKSEHAKLNGAITTLKSQYSDLHQVASTIYGKLEDSIKRLTQIIEQ
jgi:hypothetical protein